MCPFHQDTRPSLNLYPADGTSPSHFHCFACGAHGNAIDLVKQVEGLEFLPAVQWLSKQFNLPLASSRSDSENSKRESNQAALDFALHVFDSKHDAERFQGWCDVRKFSSDFLYSRGLRCITRGVLVEALQTLTIDARVELIDGLERLGLIKRLRARSQTEQLKLNLIDQFQDCFHDGRIIIPIHDVAAKQIVTVGFSGRALQNVPADGVAKYLLNSSFKKSLHLFNSPNAFKAIKQRLAQNEPATLFIVEGFLDALRLESLGLPAVALMGVSLSNEQLELLKSAAEDPASNAELTYSLFLDGDAAGTGGTNRLVRRLLDLPGVDLRWVGLPWRIEPALGKDPDTCLREFSTTEQALEWMQRFDMPAEGVILAANLGSQDSSVLQSTRWNLLAPTARERALFRSALTVKSLYGKRIINESTGGRLSSSAWPWSQELQKVLTEGGRPNAAIGRGFYLDGDLPRAALARRLAYHGARRGELPCDDEAWQTLNGNESLFDQTVLDRLRATLNGSPWHQAAPYDAVNLPRKLTSDRDALDDPRRKVMPHPADLHAQQLFLNELLTQRHDQLTATGQVFSDRIPAVRWYSSRQEAIVTGPYKDLNEPNLEWDEPKTLSFGYQIDMDVVEGDKTPTDQGMFRPFGHCWRDFMACLARQAHAIGPRVHVLRLDAKRYYDSIQRYVVRQELLKPLSEALRDFNPNTFSRILGVHIESPEYEGALERLLTGFIFDHEYHDPNSEERTQRSDEVIGIPQGPVLSAYIGTIALFPVDDEARKFIRKTSEVGPNDTRHPRAGYARYVDDIVIFGESESLLKELREKLQSKAAESSISLIHKGERVRSGTPDQIMRQLNEGRGLAVSVPAWEAPIVGDGEVDWSLGNDLPNVDRQCALQMLRHPGLMDRPGDILKQVQAAITAPDLRPGDMALCARWLWWQVAAVMQPDSVESAWGQFWTLWDSACGERDWAAAFRERGYSMLFAVEGLDRLLDANPWQANGQHLVEREQSRHKRMQLAKLVADHNFFGNPNLATNRAHVRRRARLVTRKAIRLVGGDGGRVIVASQAGRAITAIEWLCLAGAELMNPSDADPIAALRERDLDHHDELVLARSIVEQLKGAQANNISDVSLALDFVVYSAPQSQRLAVLAKFPKLLTSFKECQSARLLPHLPLLRRQDVMLFAVDEKVLPKGRNLYRYSLRNTERATQEEVSQFAHVELRADAVGTAKIAQIRFDTIDTNSSSVCIGKSDDLYKWEDLDFSRMSSLKGRAQFAADLFQALLLVHQLKIGDEGSSAYVPVKTQLLQESFSDKTVLHLIADPIPRELLGVSAWYHDRDDRVQSENVPLAGADIWRVGWSVADILGVAADMADETGERDELLDETDETLEEEQAKRALENYVLRQQLRKLQGTYLSAAQIDLTADSLTSIPGTVKRALDLLRRFPTEKSLDEQVRHVLQVDAESRAMALRIQMRSGEDLRHSLHRVFPDTLARLPLWVLEGLRLTPLEGYHGLLRPELALMISLYHAMHRPPLEAEIDRPAPPLRIALALSCLGIGLRGSVAALWGYTSSLGSRRMPENLNLPASWATPDMARLDPQGDYNAMRKKLFDGDWTGLNMASPWQWMLALIGLLDTSFAKIFDLPELKEVYVFLSAWQTISVSTDDTNSDASLWPFDTLPSFSFQQCDALMRALPKALREVDRERGIRVLTVRGTTFGRSRDSDEFVDAGQVSWQLSKPQYTSLYANSVEECRAPSSSRLFKVWTESRRIVDDELLAIHTLDVKLGKWSPSLLTELGEAESASLKPRDAAQTMGVGSRVLNENALSPLLPSEDDRAPYAHDMANQAESLSSSVLFQRLYEWQRESWRRLGGKIDGEAGELLDNRFRVALFQWRIEESYAHPLAEVGLAALPLTKSAQEELRHHLAPGSDFYEINKTGKRNAEYLWSGDRAVISWPEHRRRRMLTQALKASHDLKVQLLVLPEVSVRPETVKWLKDELRHYPGLAVLAGTYRQFEASADEQHLREQLTLLWRPDEKQSVPLGLEGSAEPIEFQRGKKYRAVAVHELFRPDNSALEPLYTEEKLLQALKTIRARAKKAEWSSDQLIGLIQELIHGPQKLRYCMELVCSELFLLTSPANRKPLEQDLAKILQHFGRGPNDAAELVNRDIEALSRLLSVSQEDRERRSVLIVPAFTSRSNDYWHAGQASVLASGTATVFCNAANKKISVGGSCFIGIDSVSNQPPDHTGIVRLLTPYHGWQKGILQPNGTGALNEADQALVVVDLDPVHVVSGKPRPQLLPEPMSLVAYLPVIELIDKRANADGLANALQNEFTPGGREILHAKLTEQPFPPACGGLHKQEDFINAFSGLLLAKQDGGLTPKSGGAALDTFAELFGDPNAVRERIMSWLRDRHQQPAPKVGEERLEPAWIDFLVSDLTWRHSPDGSPSIRVPPWLSVSPHDPSTR
ncbi:DNA primase catalytic core [Herbaspirillum sp. 1130]|nr:DNA primase catalytic core [Herbaspirillum sp. 1130]